MPNEKDARQPRAFGYGRVSTNKQEVGLEAQEKMVKGYWVWALEPQGVPWVDFWSDPATSGGTEFRSRKAAGDLWRKMLPGDHVIVSYLDRAFRDPIDAWQVLQEVRRRKCHLHIIDLRLDTTTATGELMFGIMAFMARWQRRMIAERTRDALSVIKKEPGVVFCVGTPPLGFKAKAVPGKKRGRDGAKKFRVYVADEHEMLLLRQVYILREHGEEFEKIADKFNAAKVVPRIRKGCPLPHRVWTRVKTYRYYTTYKLYLKTGRIPEWAMPNGSGVAPTVNQVTSEGGGDGDERSHEESDGGGTVEVPGDQGGDRRGQEDVG